jgi:hypothetical protein
MDPKTSLLYAHDRAKPIPAIDTLSEIDLWEPPFERWLRLADMCPAERWKSGRDKTNSNA